MILTVVATWTKGIVKARWRHLGLAAIGIPAEWHLSYGIGHGIDAEGLRHGGEFLAQRFALRR